MFTPVFAIARNPALRVAAALLFLFGIFASTIAPYQALLAITVFGLSHTAFAITLVVATCLFVLASVTLGILTDQGLSRRWVAAFGTVAYIAGTTLIWLWPGPVSYVIGHGLIMPCGTTIFAQCFALARLAALTRPEAARAGILGAIRAIFALPFVLVLPLWSLAFHHGAALLSVYPVLLATSLSMLIVVLIFWPADPVTPSFSRRSGLSFAASLREFAVPGLMLRVGLLGVVTAASGLYMALIGLSFTAAGRGDGDVALYVGFVAGAEVPFMLALPILQRHFATGTLIAAGAVTYGIHLAFLPLLAGTGFVWLLILPAALGGAATLTLPIAYIQDLMANRPGAGASLMAFQRVASDVTVAGAFVIGTALSGYGLAALIGAGFAIASALILIRIDQTRSGS